MVGLSSDGNHLTALIARRYDTNLEEHIDAGPNGRSTLQLKRNAPIQLLLGGLPRKEGLEGINEAG